MPLTAVLNDYVDDSLVLRGERTTGGHINFVLPNNIEPTKTYLVPMNASLNHDAPDTNATIAPNVTFIASTIPLVDTIPTDTYNFSLCYRAVVTNQEVCSNSSAKWALGKATTTTTTTTVAAVTAAEAEASDWRIVTIVLGSTLGVLLFSMGVVIGVKWLALKEAFATKVGGKVVWARVPRGM